MPVHASLRLEQPVTQLQVNDAERDFRNAPTGKSKKVGGGIGIALGGAAVVAGLVSAAVLLVPMFTNSPNLTALYGGDRIIGNVGRHLITAGQAVTASIALAGIVGGIIAIGISAKVVHNGRKESEERRDKEKFAQDLEYQFSRQETNLTVAELLATQDKVKEAKTKIAQITEQAHNDIDKLEVKATNAEKRAEAAEAKTREALNKAALAEASANVATDRLDPTVQALREKQAVAVELNTALNTEHQAHEQAKTALLNAGNKNIELTAEITKLNSTVDEFKSKTHEAIIQARVNNEKYSSLLKSVKDANLKIEDNHLGHTVVTKPAIV